MTKKQMKEEYEKAELEGKHWLRKVIEEKDYTLNAIYTIKVNMCTQIKNHLKEAMKDV